MKRLLSAMLIASTLFSASVALAVDAPAAKSFIDAVANDVLAIAKNDALSKPDKQKRIEDTFVDKVDIAFVSKFVLGKHWRTATPAQQQAYMDAYRPFLLKNYASKLSKYSGQTYKLKPAREDGDAAVVTMEITDTDGTLIYVDYRLRGAPGSFKIVDIAVEGVSLLTTQRSEFDSIIQQKGVDGLVEALKKQVAAKSA